MEFYKFFPIPSDRMGTIWTLSSIKDAYVIEFGPAGTTHFAIEGMMQLNGEHRANIYTTHINETDISFGTHKRLEKAIMEVDENYNPKVIFIMASSISAIIGTDIESICYEMQPKIQAKLIPITTGGYNGDHTLGIEKTLYMLCKEIVKETENKKINTYNIIGNNVDMFNFLSDAEEIKSIMKESFGAEINTVFTAYTSVEEIENSSEGQLNLVLRGEGIKAAKALEKEHNISYYYGRPYGLEGTVAWIRGVEEVLGIKANEKYLNKKISQIRKHLISYKFMIREIENKSVVLVGDYDVIIGLASFMEELGLKVKKLIVKHNLCKKVKNFIPEKWKDIIEFNLNEEEIEIYLNTSSIYLLLADGATLKLNHKSKLQFQISNPNLLKHSIYPYTPFVGFNGALYLIQCLFELDKIKNSY
ncbi:nitrogenase component 1 type Oxidoreductase family protein [Clostridium argentinense CDC 2741]|uniref:Nitrogenase component 1 type Oxidoreductase family protein n=1 Tax=Clostridium argentinense CDC 2741 TaxID=1418104 RepID=A0A0C1TV78_9CLOT|nr:nitrogenase component 1 [Clostridium argentinense]ARC83869.1 oxalate:formate antiporter [Clostridium argentinense]KIE44634.1 nitrogenase component 1 type Oxidoreductase family protein [Clostridium argentinense CDC 2741]NFF39777.1 oxalate:formate antiporter [Clostridium argentinense]NFP49777.1 oxalate:formate antiporter [Clostridium argentinense]NFP72178.1 oxalate:formate antiporter [Clostridium argentinense]